MPTRDYQSQFSHYRWTPASVDNPAMLTTPILMSNPKGPQAVGGMTVGGDNVGYFGLALNSKQRIKKNTDKLARLHRKLLRVQQEIDATEDKLESLGVDVDDLYEDLGITDGEGHGHRRPRQGSDVLLEDEDDFGGRTPV